MCEFEAYQHALGIRTTAGFKFPIQINDFPLGSDSGVETNSINCLVSQHPLYAVGSYDGNVRLISTRTWAVAFVLPTLNPSDMPSVMQSGVVTTIETSMAPGLDVADSTLNRTVESSIR